MCPAHVSSVAGHTPYFFLDRKLMRRPLTLLAAGVPLAAAVYLPTASAETNAASAATSSACAAPSVKAPAGT
jgi:feruloyl esterase